ncbi:MAG: hypothetical protein EXX96DRAFT_587438 [Benjaminiella poitrasii]|nr:MAG: hypothetical protein EXX96DRAFT_587438 [Benjaminiella poitrasii]
MLKSLHLLFTICCFFQIILGQQQVAFRSLSNPFTVEWIQVLEQFYNTFGNHSKDDSSCLYPIPEFDCEPFMWNDGIIKRDAYHLRPNDIKVNIAIGDSITAGFGMISGRPPFSSTILEYRGKAFSVGGDKGEYTIPNFLSKYGEDIIGPPTGYTLPLSRGKKLNNAISGAKSQELNQEVSRLVRLLNTHPEYKAVRDEWKLITVFIGANNVCVLCEPPITTLPDLANADIFEANVRHVLERVRTEVKKSFVNLVALFNVSSVYEASRGDPYCEFVLDPSHMVVCSCIQGNEKQRRAADRVVNEYNLRLEKLEHEFKHKDIQNFGISYQPGFKEFPVAKYNQSYFSGIDCFHPNKCANQLMAILLWNVSLLYNEDLFI